MCDSTNQWCETKKGSAFWILGSGHSQLCPGARSRLGWIGMCVPYPVLGIILHLPLGGWIATPFLCRFLSPVTRKQKQIAHPPLRGWGRNVPPHVVLCSQRHWLENSFPFDTSKNSSNSHLDFQLTFFFFFPLEGKSLLHIWAREAASGGYMDAFILAFCSFSLLLQLLLDLFIPTPCRQYLWHLTFKSTTWS